MKKKNIKLPVFKIKIKGNRKYLYIDMSITGDSLHIVSIHDKMIYIGVTGKLFEVQSIEQI